VWRRARRWEWRRGVWRRRRKRLGWLGLPFGVHDHMDMMRNHETFLKYGAILSEFEVNPGLKTNQLF